MRKKPRQISNSSGPGVAEVLKLLKSRESLFRSRSDKKKPFNSSCKIMARRHTIKTTGRKEMNARSLRWLTKRLLLSTSGCKDRFKSWLKYNHRIRSELVEEM
ncbi:D-arabinitol 2-dehydrogenase [Fusarium oxysporum f. sp. albedinis]|nr:D-arabinitol 2-dehydrogenase [Fusarium oxysporum f. sp. albedinis]